MSDIFSKVAKQTAKRPREEKFIESEPSYFSFYSDKHLEIYGVLPKVTELEFNKQFKRVIDIFNDSVTEEELFQLLESFLIRNKETNVSPFNSYCTISSLTNDYALSYIWPEIRNTQFPVEFEKKLEKPNKAYYGIEEHLLYITLDDGLSNNRILKTDCHEVKKDGESYFYPKDNRTKSLYDYDGLMEFLEIKKPHDFGEMSYVNGSPCYGFYVCSTFPDQCNYKCSKFKKLRYLFKASEIPVDYLEPMPFTESPDLKDSTDLKTLSLLEIRDNIIFYVESGFNAVLYSKQTGTGKTSWACTIAKHFIFRRMPKNMLEPEAFYLNTAEYFSLIKSSMSLKDENIHIEIAQLNNLIKDVPLLIIDDIGTEKPSEFVRERLYQIINYRSSNRKSTIYTTNLDFNSSEAVDILGSRIVSRLRNSTIIDFDREEN